MPELPEVEIIKLGLQRKIVGLTIKKIEVLDPTHPSSGGKTFIGDVRGIRGQKILRIWRKAKILGIDLGSLSLLFHLKMTGQLIYDDPSTALRTSGRFIGGHPTPDMRDEMPNRSTRIIFTFSDGSRLYFNDQRRFGWVKVVKDSAAIAQFIEKLGPEPLEKDFSWETLKNNLLKHKSMPIKKAIMDQTVVSGVGNIYANEACFIAKLDPKTKVSDMDDKQFRSLHRGVRKALRDGIKYGGASRAHFVDAQGHKGYFLDYAYVYGRDKHPCRICKTEINKIQLGGRGTYFCPACQR